ncbi:GNAT family N-acetyltransferase [Erythrobacter aureus]|uniref:GNAT family N-acetyltransferase n=1 Tax=Erythrobacter aureus TaxID=2182384 RepID=UPI0013B4555D|nr:GNAT family N-acetyltransferase [Erythrobacter aureus]
MKPAVEDGGSVRVRRAATTDCGQLIDLIRAHARYEDSSATLTSETLSGLLSAADPPIEILVASCDDRVLGYAAMTYDFSLWRAHLWAHLDCLFVTENSRGMAVGRKLFDSALLRADEKGADRLEWQTPAWNDGAVRFYRRLDVLECPKLRFAKELAGSAGALVREVP